MSGGFQLRFWMIGGALFCAVLWLFAPVLLPFVTGLAVAYFLDPLVDWLEAWRLPRWLATVLALLSFLLAVVVVLGLLAPLVQAQVFHLLDVLPGYAARAREAVEPLWAKAIARLSPDDVERLRGSVGQYVGDVISWVGKVARSLLNGGLALFDILSLLFITPGVSFYLLRDWDLLVAKVDSWLPRPHLAVIREQCGSIDRTLSGFVRGQALVCLCLGGFYALALSLAGLDFGLVVGLLSGILSFIPFVGTLFGFAASTGLALLQFDSPLQVGFVVGIFAFGQLMEGNVLTPKLVGDKVGLHPVWVMFALLAGGATWGFLGVLLAVPGAACIGVLIRFALGRYLSSPLYADSGSGDDPPP